MRHELIHLLWPPRNSSRNIIHSWLGNPGSAITCVRGKVWRLTLLLQGCVHNWDCECCSLTQAHVLRFDLYRRIETHHVGNHTCSCLERCCSLKVPFKTPTPGCIAQNLNQKYAGSTTLTIWNTINLTANKTVLIGHNLSKMQDLRCKKAHAIDRSIAQRFPTSVLCFEAFGKPRSQTHKYILILIFDDEHLYVVGLVNLT